MAPAILELQFTHSLPYLTKHKIAFQLADLVTTILSKLALRVVLSLQKKLLVKISHQYHVSIKITFARLPYHPGAIYTKWLALTEIMRNLNTFSLFFYFFYHWSLPFQRCSVKKVILKISNEFYEIFKNIFFYRIHSAGSFCTESMQN